MSEPSKHEKTIDLAYCWVCGLRFISAGGSEPVHHHHVVPRAYGGTEGPTVSICTNHHSKLHEIAKRLQYGKPFFDQTKGENQDVIKKLMYLAQTVFNAEQATRNDPNKAAVCTVTLNARHKLMIDKLKTSGMKSRESILLHALEVLYKRNFPL